MEVAHRKKLFPHGLYAKLSLKRNPILAGEECGGEVKFLSFPIEIKAVLTVLKNPLDRA
jgi:hypothetical protein